MIKLAKNEASANAIASFVATELGRMPYDSGARWIASTEEDGRLLGVVVFSNWGTHHVEADIWSDGTGRWCTRQFLNAVYMRAFEVWEKARINMVVEVSNVKAINMHRKLGHVEEALLRNQFGVGKDALLFGYTVQDYQDSRWYKWRMEKGWKYLQ